MCLEINHVIALAYFAPGGGSSDARTSRSRNGAPRPRAGDGGRALRQGRGSPRRSALAAAEGFCATPERQDRDRPRPARQISSGRSVLRRRAVMHLGMSGSFHVVHEKRQASRPLLSRALETRRARSRRLSHVVRRQRDLQRSAPLRIDEARRRATSSTPSRCSRVSAPSRSATHSTPPCWRAPATARRQASRRRCWISASSPGSAISMFARRCIAPGCRPSAMASTIADRNGEPNERARTAGRQHQGGAQCGDQGRRLVAARSQAHRRRARHVPASLPGLRSRGRACRTPGCSGTVKRIVQNGRSTFYCPACQK